MIWMDIMLLKYNNQQLIVNKIIQKSLMTLNKLLSEQSPICVPQFFQFPQIVAQIKSSLQPFIQYCIQNETFTNQMISMGIKTQMHEHANHKMRQISYAINQILTSDLDQIANLFIIDQTNQKIRCYSQDQQQIIQEIVKNQITEQFYIINNVKEQQNKLFYKKYKYLIFLLEYLDLKQPNQNCINYLIKIFNTLIRVKGQALYQFFCKEKKMLARMIQLIEYQSIYVSIIKFINELEQQKYQQFVMEIVHQVKKIIIQRINSQSFQKCAEFIQEIFTKNRNNGEYLLAQPFVNDQILTTILHGIFTAPSSLVQSNSILYLLKIIQKINIQQYKSTQNQQTNQLTYTNQKPQSAFKINTLFTNLQQLVQIAPLINRQKYSSIQIFNYYDLILQLCINNRFSSASINKTKALITLMKVLTQNQLKFNGIIKGKIVSIIESLIRASQKLMIKQLPQQSRKLIEHQQSQLKSLMLQSNCFIQKLKILLNISNNQQIINKYSSLLFYNKQIETNQIKTPKQLQFTKDYLKQHQLLPSQTTNHQLKGSKQSTANQQQQKNGKIILIKQNNGQKQSKHGLQINVNILNDKINAHKARKQQKNQQQHNKKSDKQQQQIQQQQIIIIANTNHIQQNACQEDLINNSYGKKVNYYSPHLQIF